MNKVEEQIFQAIDVLVEKKISELAYDKTIQAKIYSVVDSDTGEYKVRYNGNIFSAFANDLSQTYKIDEQVYVQVPEGDFSNRKLIVASMSDRSLSYAQMQQLQNTIVPVSPSLTEMYAATGQEPYQVVAGAVKDGVHYQDIIYEGPSEYAPSDFHDLFQRYLSQHETLQVSCSFLTQLQCVHNQGNYGLELEFYTQKGEAAKYRLDISQFNGTPYNFTSYAPQSAVIQLPKDYVIGLKSIKFFQEGFIPDRIIENGIITDKQNLTVPNIFAKDVSINFVELQDLTDASYYLTISAPQGMIFSGSVAAIDLVGRLLHQGEDIINSKNTTCQWYERDLSVTVGTSYYDKIAGPDWKKIDNTTNMLSLTAKDVLCWQDYKLVVVYNKTTFAADIRVFNYSSGYQLAIQQETIGEEIRLSLTDSSLVGTWYVLYPDGTYIQVTDAIDVNSIRINEYMRYPYLTFYCAAKNSGGQYLGVVDYTVNNATSQDDVVTSYEGQDIYQYGAGGSFSIEDSERDRTLVIQLKWKDGYAVEPTYIWTMASSREVIPNTYETRFNPQNSMLYNVWLDNKSNILDNKYILHYNIRQEYNVKYNNNTIRLTIGTTLGDTYTFDKEILFLKDGDQGTNGTDYIAAVRPCDASGLKLSGLQPLLYNNGWLGSLPVRCYVYKDGELINDDITNYTITYQWTGGNVLINGSPQLTTNTPEWVQITGSGTEGLANGQFYVSVQIRIREHGDNPRDITIYTLYPIDIAVGGYLHTLADISEIPGYIKYSSSGLNPSYYNRPLQYLYENVTYNNLISILTPQVLSIRNNTEGERYLRPVASFIGDIKNNTVGALKLECPTNSSQYLIHPIIMYLDTYGNEDINGWDGTKLLIDEVNGQYMFAPQVGAGEKDEANRFTGVVMGKDSAQDKIGLYGYQHGINTFGLMQDGTAFFGAKTGGGRIVINGMDAVIYGGDGGDSATGMTLTLANLKPGQDTDAIKIGAGNFKVTYGGKLYATGADIIGDLYAQTGRIGCDANRNGGWVITTNQISSDAGDRGYVALNSDVNTDYAIWIGSSNPGTAYVKSSSDVIGHIDNPAPFVVTRDGFVYCKNARINGRIESNEGTIGGWVIEANKLYNLSASNFSVGMSSLGRAAFWVGTSFNENSVNDDNVVDDSYFLVTRTGEVYCKKAKVSGDITATTLTCVNGNIGGWSITDRGFSNGNNHLYSNGDVKLGDNFTMTSGGDLYLKGTVNATELTCTYGNIGGWSITSEGFEQGDLHICSNGDIYLGERFEVNSDGLIVHGVVQADSGYIAGWSIENNGLENGINHIYPNGETQLGQYFQIDKNGAVNLHDLKVYKTFTKVGNTVVPSDLVGEIGWVTGNTGSATTTNLGITSQKNYSIILDSAENIRLSALGAVKDDRGIYLQTTGQIGLEAGENQDITIRAQGSEGGVCRMNIYKGVVLYIGGNKNVNPGAGTGEIRCLLPADNQYGIYARFA